MRRFLIFTLLLVSCGVSYRARQNYNDSHKRYLRDGDTIVLVQKHFKRIYIVKSLVYRRTKFPFIALEAYYTVHNANGFIPVNMVK